MHKILMVIRREYLDRVKKRSFWIGTFLFPLLMVGLILMQFLLADVGGDIQRRIAMLDATGSLFEPVRELLEEEKLNDGTPAYSLELFPIQGTLDETRKSLEPRVQSDELFGIITIGPDLEAEGNYGFYTKNVGNLTVLRAVRRALRDSVVGLRFERSDLGMDQDQLRTLLAPIELDSFQVTAGAETKKKGFQEAYFGTFAFVLILYMALLLYGIAMMRGILEEKSSRVMEVLLGSLTPDQLMTGKILGIGLVGLTQMAIYAVTAGVARLYMMASTVQLGWSAALDAATFSKMIYFVVFFLLGYFLFTALFAAVGAVCNSEQEAQNLQTPLTLCLVIPLVANFFFMEHADSTAAVVFSLIPLFTPMVMFMRIMVLTPPFWQIALSILIMLATTYLLFKGVARIFRIGILMYGKRPTVPEILRWARG